MFIETGIRNDRAIDICVASHADYDIVSGLMVQVPVWVSGDCNTPRAFDADDVFTKWGFDILVNSIESLKGAGIDRVSFRRNLSTIVANEVLELEMMGDALRDSDLEVYNMSVDLDVYKMGLNKNIIEFFNNAATALKNSGEDYEFFVGLARYVAAKNALLSVGVDHPHSLGEIYKTSKEILEETDPQTIGGVEKRAAAIGAQVLAEKAEMALQLTSNIEYEFLECWGIL